MNAHVKPAVFMPLFATSTAEGPVNHEALIAQMHAAGMMAGAWMVEDMVRRLKGIDGSLPGMSGADIERIVEGVKELSSALWGIHSDMDELDEALSGAVCDVEDEDYDEDIHHAATRAERVTRALYTQATGVDRLIGEMIGG